RTILLGVGLLVLQLRDYAHTGFGIHDGIYPSLFYVMTSLHMAHVFGGVLFLALVLAQSRTGQLSMVRHEPVEAGAIYWHFVDVVWIGLFAVFYVIVRRGGERELGGRWGGAGEGVWSWGSWSRRGY